MNSYRSRATQMAVQYQGEPIPEVTCEGTGEQRLLNGCDNTRAHNAHVHTRAIGGLNVLKSGDWIIPVIGGPFALIEDARFRSMFEVLGADVLDDQVPVLQLEAPVADSPAVQQSSDSGSLGSRSHFAFEDAVPTDPVAAVEPQEPETPIEDDLNPGASGDHGE